MGPRRHRGACRADIDGRARARVSLAVWGGGLSARPRVPKRVAVGESSEVFEFTLGAGETEVTKLRSTPRAINPADGMSARAGGARMGRDGRHDAPGRGARANNIRARARARGLEPAPDRSPSFPHARRSSSSSAHPTSPTAKPVPPRSERCRRAASPRARARERRIKRLASLAVQQAIPPNATMVFEIELLSWVDWMKNYEEVCRARSFNPARASSTAPAPARRATLTCSMRKLLRTRHGRRPRPSSNGCVLSPRSLPCRPHRARARWP